MSGLKSKKWAQARTGYLFLLFPLIIFGAFTIFPMVFAFVISLYDWNLLIPDKPFVGLANYIELFQDEVFLIAIKNTIIYAAGVVPVQTILALFLAFIMNQKLPGRAFFRTAFYIPAVTASVVTSTIFIWVYSKPGLLNYLLSQVGIEGTDWLTNTNTALFSIMALNIWSTSGYFMITFLAGLQNIPQSVYEAAKIDGASTWTQFWKITVPMVRPVTYFVVVLSLIGCFQVFDQVFIMSQGGPVNSTTTMSFFTYLNSFKYFRLGYGAASAIVLAIIIYVVTVVQKKYLPPDPY